MNNVILQVDDIQKYYGNKGSLTKAVDHISFQVCKGEFVGIMGASGSGNGRICRHHGSQRFRKDYFVELYLHD